tara:strand:- start:190 stop:654 length:465 start_codon:yes stop_codon:yes gene_type:complete
MSKISRRKGTEKAVSLGGLDTAANIMNLVKTDMANEIMDDISEQDENLAHAIQDNMFRFNTLAAIDDRSIQQILRNIDGDELMVALKGASADANEKFLHNMSKRARGRFRDDLEALGPIRTADVETAQKKITRKARQLADSGEIVLSINRNQFI